MVPRHTPGISWWAIEGLYVTSITRLHTYIRLNSRNPRIFETFVRTNLSRLNIFGSVVFHQICVESCAEVGRSICEHTYSGYFPFLYLRSYVSDEVTPSLTNPSLSVCSNRIVTTFEATRDLALSMS